MKLENLIYDWIKAIGQVLLPELVTLILVCLNAKKINTEMIAPVLAEIIVFWNAIVMTWNKVYHDQQAELKEKENINDYDATDPNEGIG